jgi:hypothetical protein
VTEKEAVALVVCSTSRIHLTFTSHFHTSHSHLAFTIRYSYSVPCCILLGAIYNLTSSEFLFFAPDLASYTVPIQVVLRNYFRLTA